ncbi:MAG TPA: hypothetical protein VLH08_09305, partial [Acidobacteriota bacterium]|nr:hypothetical protein [Acidobacteriota bacterium]
MSIRRLLFLSIILLLTATYVQPVTGIWTTREPMPISSSEFGSATILGKMYSAGGYLFENQNTFLIYDPRTNQWKRGPDLPQANHHSAVVAVADKLYVLGGHHVPSAVQIFDPATQKWSTGAPV